MYHVECGGQCERHGGRLPGPLFDPQDFVFMFPRSDDRDLQLFPDHWQRAELLAALGPHEFLMFFTPGPHSES